MSQFAASASGEHSRATPEVQKYRPRACQSCARSKMRCVWPSEPGATPCQRCTKIKAPCTLPEINPRRRRGPSTRVGQLEIKLDGIMSLLNASQQIQQNSPSPSAQSPPLPSSVPPPLSASYEQQREHGRNSIHQLLNPNIESSNTTPTTDPPLSSNLHTNARLIPSAGLVAPASLSAAISHPSSPNNLADTIEIVKNFRVTLYKADRALNMYRSLYVPYFPFVPIPAMMGAHDLYTKTPFLFRTVVAVTTPQAPAVQEEWRTWFRSWIAEHVVVNNEKRLEILQAILIYLAWGDFNFLIESQATNLIQLAVSLVIDLGLNRWPLDFGKATFLMLKEGAVNVNSGERAAMASGKTPWKKKHSLDEMRAALGTFYVTSLCAALFRRHQPMACTSYMAKCCNEIDETQEYDSDKFLVALVKLQQLLDKVADLIPYSDDEAGRSVQYAPHHMALTSVQRDIEALIREQPPSVECNALLWTHYHATICRLYEPVIYIRSNSPSTHTPTARTTALWTSLHAARDFVASYLVIPPQNLLCIPFHSAQLTFCLATAVRLLLLADDPDWTSELARQAVDFDALCGRVAHFFDEAERVSVGLGRRIRYLHDGERSVLMLFRDKVRWVRSLYAARTARSHAQYEAARAKGAAGGENNESNSNITARGGMGSSSFPGSQMDVDYDSMAAAQAALPGDLDETFWQALFEWGGNGVGTDWMEEVQS